MSTTAPSFYVTGGTLHQDAPSYVERHADRDLYEALTRGEFCYILTARQMGKSSLMARCAHRLREEGVAVAILDLTAIGQNLSPEQWYDGLRWLLGQQLALDDELDDFWLAHERLGPLQRWLAALQQVVLARVPGRIVLFVEEVDTVLSLPFSTDEFFAGIRECYNRRVQDPEFQRLTFCLLGVASPSDLIQDTRTTPFNIGKRIELTDFTEAEAVPLAEGLRYPSPCPLPETERGSAPGPADGRLLSPEVTSPSPFRGGGRGRGNAGELLQRVLYWTGGHPYLTQRLCQAVAEDGKVTDPAIVDRLCEALFLSPSAREQDDNLLFVRERLLKSEADRAALLDLYRQVRSGKRVRLDDTNQLVSLLRLSGITRIAEGTLRVRNRIYERVFDRQWIVEHMPDAELQRQRAAYRRGMWRAAAISGVVLAAMGGLAVTAVNQARRADRQRQAADQQRQVADQQRLEARRNLYASQMNTVQRVWDDGNMGRAVELVEAWRPKPGEEDLRGWEWRYLWRLCQDGSRFTLPQGGPIWYCLALSPDQRLLAVSPADSNALRLWDLSTRREVASLRGHKKEVRAVAFSPDGRLLATGSFDGTIKLWDRTSLRLLATLPGHKGMVGRVIFFDDGRKIASRGTDLGLSPDGKTISVDTVKLWDVGTRKVLAIFRPRPSGAAGSLALTPDGRTMAVGASDPTGALPVIQLWDIPTHRETAILLGHMAHAICLAFSPDGRLLASGSEDSTVGLWDLTGIRAAGRRARSGWVADQRRPVILLRGHRGNVDSVAFSPDGKTLASTGEDSTLRLWDVARRTMVTTLKGHKGQTTAVLFSPDGRTLASAGSDGAVKLWNPVARSEATLFRGHQYWINCLAISPDGKIVASEGSDGIVKLWNATTLQVQSVLPKHGKQVFCVVFSPDGRFLASGSDDQTVRLWDLGGRPKRVGGRPAATFKGLAWYPRSGLVFSADSKTLAISGGDKTVRLWDVLSHRQVAVLKTRMNPRWMASSPDGKTLAASGGWEPVELWDVPSRRVVASLGRGDAVAISPDGKTLAIAEDKAVKLWDLTTRRATVTLKGSASSRMWTLEFSPDGQTLAAGCFDSTIKVWSLTTKQEVAVLKGHTGSIMAIAFSPDGNTLMSGGIDGTVRLWRAATFQETDPLQVVASSSNRTVTLQWQPLSWAIGYNVYRSRPGANRDPLMKLNTQPVVGGSFTDRDSDLASSQSRLYAAAPLYRGAPGRAVEGPRVILRAAPIAAPPGWMGTSINEGLRSGSVLFDARTALAGRVVLRGSGEDFGGAADGGYFLNQPVEGDFQITVQALSRPTEAIESAKAGLMLRESLDPGARNASLLTTAAHGLIYQWRPAASDLTESKDVVDHARLKLPILLRMTRQGNTITAEYSTDHGKSFHRADAPFPFQPPLPKTIYAGLAITSHDPTRISQATFSGLEIRLR